MLYFEQQRGDKLFVTEKNAQKPKQVKDPNESENAPDFYARWYGKDNLYPQKLQKIIKKNPQLASTLYWKARTLVSGGLMYGYIEYDQEGREKLIPADKTKFPEIERFLHANKIKRYIPDQALDFYKFWNAFPTFIRSKDRKEIVGLRLYDSPFCRWSRQDNEGKVRHCYIHADWDLQPTQDDKNLIKYNAVQEYNGVEDMQETNGNIFVYPLRGISSGEIYYQLQEPLHALVQSKWIDVVDNIPRFKAAMMKRQISVKYIIHMPDYWMSEVRYPETWEDFDDDEKMEKVKEEYEKMDKFLTDIDNAGASILATFKTNPHTNEAFPGWKIEKVEPNLMSDAYNADSEIGSSYIATALGVPKQLLGVSPGRALGNSGGSEIRNLFNMYMSNVKSELDIQFEPFEFIRDYNGWDPNLRFWSKTYWLTTLDNVSTSNRNFNTDAE